MTMALACHGKAEKPAPPPLEVHVVTVQSEEVIDYDDYQALLTSRHSISIHPQVSGTVKRIAAKPGAHVAAGDVLVEIDAGPQRAQYAQLQANVETRRANLAYATLDDRSARELAEAGAIPTMNYAQKHAQYLALDADVKSAEAELRGQAELLRFYRIVAPGDGVVGDVPVKVGDYVSPATELTSVDQDVHVEAYVYVPVAKAARIGPGTTVIIQGRDGKPDCHEAPSFVSKLVESDTQTVLVKSLCPNEGALRSDEIRRARVVWGTRQGLLVPVPAVTRQAGKAFVFTVESSTKGDVARQAPVEVGPVVGDRYVIEKGLAPGAVVAVSDVQKLRDGAPVKRAP
jgi:RND family efflux transporter MFP subunit